MPEPFGHGSGQSSCPGGNLPITAHPMKPADRSANTTIPINSAAYKYTHDGSCVKSSFTSFKCRSLIEHLLVWNLLCSVEECVDRPLCLLHVNKRNIPSPSPRRLNLRLHRMGEGTGKHRMDQWDLRYVRIASTRPKSVDHLLESGRSRPAFAVG